ncbi:hypothetical protein NMY22_g3942 [Coprinellus aureogranulatus]|nr:hypothetical protein NMY22_g3942 [Coprinellus aureogranulatus]
MTEPNCRAENASRGTPCLVLIVAIKRTASSHTFLPSNDDTPLSNVMREGYVLDGSEYVREKKEHFPGLLLSLEPFDIILSLAFTPVTLSNVLIIQNVAFQRAGSKYDQRRIEMEDARISFTTLYVYYVLTTVDEEVSVIYPQKWRQGKVLFMFIRYAPFINIALKLVRDYRNYYTISAWACKVLKAYEVPYLLTTLLSCAVAFGFCLSANKIVTILIVILAAGNNLVAFVFALISLPQYPVGAPSALLVALGYPCYIPSSAEVAQATILDLGLDIRCYVAFATAIVTLMLAIAALATRYNGHHGPLVQIVRNDGGIYCIAVAALRFGLAITSTPRILPVGSFLQLIWAVIDLHTHRKMAKWASNVAVQVFAVSTATITPMLVQRLMINIRTADYIGSEPAASKLLFAPPPLTSEDNNLALTRDKDILEMPSTPTGASQPAVGSVSKARTIVENILRESTSYSHTTPCIYSPIFAR